MPKEPNKGLLFAVFIYMSEIFSIWSKTTNKLTNKDRLLDKGISFFFCFSHKWTRLKLNGSKSKVVSADLKKKAKRFASLPAKKNNKPVY